MIGVLNQQKNCETSLLVTGSKTQQSRNTLFVVHVYAYLPESESPIIVKRMQIFNS